MNEEIRGHIYCITNTINKKLYIGQTVSHRKSKNNYVEFGYKKRFKEHLVTSQNKSISCIATAINLYGKDNFNVELLEECDMKDIDQRERYWMDTKNSLYPNGYNILYGPPYAFDDESRLKISNTLLSYFKNIEIRRAYSKLHLNKFKYINKDLINNIDIHHIKESGENKFIYMYITYKNSSKDRRRYGGIHEDYNDTFIRCYNDALELLNNDETKINIYKNRTESIIKDINSSEIKEIQIGKFNNCIAVYIIFNYTESYKDKKRYVFGGKNIKFEESYNSALEFVDSIKTQTTVVNIKKSVIATLPN